MKLTVVSCECGNPKLHVKFQDEAGRKTDGIFSLTQGTCMLLAMKRRGEMSETEITEAKVELASTRLPELPQFTDEELEGIALETFLGTTTAEYETEFAKNLEAGLVTGAQVDRLREMIDEHATDPLMQLVRGVAEQ